MRATIPGSGALGRQLKMQSSGQRNQTPLSGLKKPSPRVGFAHLDSHKPKPCEAELCRVLLGALCYRWQHWDMQRSCERAAEVLSWWQGQGQLTHASLGCCRMLMDVAWLYVSPTYGLKAKLCFHPPKSSLCVCFSCQTTRDCREKGLLLRHPLWQGAKPGSTAVLHIGKERSAS